jgi:membrane fusion protein
MVELMSQELFRREVFSARANAWLGSIALNQPLRLWVLSAAALAAALVVALYLVCGTYTRRSTVAGQLVPTLGLATVQAPMAGVLSELRVQEGAQVAAGQVLAVITVPHIEMAGGAPAVDLEESLRSRRQSLESAQQGQLRALAATGAGLAAQLAAARDELGHVRSAIATRERQVELGAATLARLRGLQAHHYVSERDISQQESVVLDQTGALQELQRQASASERTILQLQQALDELPGQRRAVTANAERDLEALAQEQLQMRAPGMFVIAAPVAGVVAAQLLKAGQSVQTGQSLLTLLPGDGQLQAELLVPSRAIGFVANGDRVLLRYQAFPWQKFGHQLGHVAGISRSALLASEPGAQPLYRVIVSLAHQTVTAHGRAELLKPGMALDADILGETRRLIEWLFEPLYSLKQKVSG